MLFGQDRNQLRQFFFDVWRKTQDNTPLEPLEEMVAGVIRQHPEYHALLTDAQAELERDYTPELGQTNPFLHMGMHIAIHEQLSTQRPVGILELYQQLVAKLQDPHAVEHHMMECLGTALWEAQRSGQAPDDNAYLECIKRLASR